MIFPTTIDHSRCENKSFCYSFGQVEASVRKHSQRGTVSYGDGERDEEGIAVVLPSLVAGIITDSPTKEFTMPEAE